MASIISIKSNGDNRQPQDDGPLPHGKPPTQVKSVDVVSLDVVPGPKPREKIVEQPASRSVEMIGVTIEVKPAEIKPTETTTGEATFSWIDSRPGQIVSGQFESSKDQATPKARVTLDDCSDAAAPRRDQTHDISFALPREPKQTPFPTTHSKLTSEFRPPKPERIQPGPGDSAEKTTINGQYRGVGYSIVKSVLKDSWKWTARVGKPEMLRMGDAPNLEQAELIIRDLIDRAISVEQMLSRQRSAPQ